MGVDDSSLRDRVLFIEGAPRSGTSWLATLIATHPQVAGTAAETHLFDRGLGALFDNYESPAWGAWLSSYVREDELVDLARDLCDGVFARMRERTKPAAPFIVEKTPLLDEAPTRVVQRKLRCFPDGWYLHLVRDERAVVRSLLRAPFTGGRSEAELARRYRESTHAIREVLGGHSRYRELDYETLRSDPARHTGEIFEWLGLDTDASVIARMRELSDQRYARLEPVPPAPPHPGRSWRRVAAALRRRNGRGTSRARPPAAAGALMAALREAQDDRVRELTTDDLVFELRSGAGDVSAEGDEARAALLRAGETIFRRGFVTYDWLPAEGETFSSFQAQALLGDASRMDVSICTVQRGDSISRVTVIAAGDLAGRRPQKLEDVPA